MKNAESAVLPQVLGGRAPHHWRRQKSVVEMVVKIDFCAVESQDLPN